MREIEVKARVHNPEAVLAALDAASVTLGQPRTQRDIVYCEPGAQTNVAGHNFLRVRIENDTQATLTLKQTIKNLDKIEHETAIDNPDKMIAMLELMHYELYNDLTKVRRPAQYVDYEICYDDVTDLGTFIEIEKLCPDDADGEQIHAELWGILSGFGISRDDEVHVGYDILMRENLGHD